MIPLLGLLAAAVLMAAGNLVENNVFIGNGEGERGGCSVHNPGYDFNDDILAVAASYWVKLAEAYLR